jgi:hypothetical protein
MAKLLRAPFFGGNLDAMVNVILNEVKSGHWPSKCLPCRNIVQFQLTSCAAIQTSPIQYVIKSLPIYG